MSYDDPGQLARAAARRELQALQIEAIDEIDIEAIAAYRKLFVVDGALEGAAGRTVTHAGFGIIRVSREVTQVERRRFIVAHEIGHCLMHQTGSVRRCTDGDLFRYDDGNKEAEANWFAAELLMPGNLFRPLCNIARPSFDAIGAIAKKCGTTLTSASIRFVQLGPERCAFVWSEQNKVKWSVRSPDFPEWIARDRVLSGYSHASDVFAGRPIPTGPQVVPGRAWLERFSADQDLMEETIPFQRLGAALTLLWLPAQDEEEDEGPGWRPR